jgi:hypothetical protein
MMNDNFILKKEDLPDELRKDRLLQALEGLLMNPMEREMLKRKLNYEDLSYRDDLVREFFRFYKIDPSLFNIEMFGISNELVWRLVGGFKEHLRETFDVLTYTPRSKSPNATRLLVVNKIVSESVKISPLKTDLGLEVKSRSPNIALECIGYFKTGTKDILVLCIIFDRFYNTHGFVVFDVDFKYKEESARQERMREEEENEREEGP